MHVTSIGNLRPCEHQVAGHLFEEGKAGSLVDDRGHFYKPIQVGPRGDREREFYEAVSASLAEEEQQREELQARTAAAAVQQQPLQNGRVGGAAAVGHAPRSSPKQIQTARPSLASVRVPSFRQRDDSHGAVQIAQRDEFGLLGTPTLRDLRVGGSGDDWLGRSPDSEGAELTAEHLMDGFSLHHSDGHAAGAAGHASSARQQQQHGQQQQQQQHVGQQRQQAQQQQQQQQYTQHVPKALSDPRHAEAAALLGQPVFDVELRPPGQAAYRAHHHYHHHYEPQPQAQPQACRRSSPLGKEDSKRQGQLAASPHSSPFQLGPAFEDGDADAAMHAADGEVLDAGAPSQQQHDQRGLAAAAGQHPAVGGQASAVEPGSSSGGISEQQQPAFSIADRSFSAPAAAGSYDAHGLELRGLEMPEASAELAAQGEARAGDSSIVAGPSSALSPRGGPRTWLGDSTSDSEEEGDSAAVGCSSGVGGRAARRSVFPRLPFSVRNALLLETIPKFYGVVEAEGRTFLELEDLTRNYRRPSIIDIKVGFRTWYPSASQAYIERCRVKDGSTTQASLGFKICGMQVYRHGQGGYWRASKRWCKTLPAELVDKALLSFAHNEGGVRPEHVYGGPHGAIAQLQSLESWFELQREFHFYSSSVLILYEGGATAGEDARVRVRCVDFAHTFKLEEGRQQRDHNYLAGLRAIIARLAGVLRADATDSLA